MSRKNRILLSTAATLAVGMGFFALASRAGASIVYDANSGAANAGGVFAGDSHFGQDITLTGTGSETLNAFTVFGIRWNASSTTSQDLFLDFYTGADESNTSSNALAGATLLGSTGFGLSYPGAVGSYNYTLNVSASNIVVPADVPVFVEATFTNAAGNAYSTILNARFSPGAPVTGSNPGFVWIDSNLDGVFTGAEQSSNVSGGTVSNIRMAIDASPTPVPEPTTLGLLTIGGALVGIRRRRLGV